MGKFVMGDAVLGRVAELGFEARKLKGDTLLGFPVVVSDDFEDNSDKEPVKADFTTWNYIQEVEMACFVFLQNFSEEVLESDRLDGIDFAEHAMNWNRMVAFSKDQSKFKESLLRDFTGTEWDFRESSE